MALFSWSGDGDRGPPERAKRPKIRGSQSEDARRNLYRVRRSGGAQALSGRSDSPLVRVTQVLLGNCGVAERCCGAEQCAMIALVLL